MSNPQAGTARLPSSMAACVRLACQSALIL